MHQELYTWGLQSYEITPIGFVVWQPVVYGGERPSVVCLKALHSEDDREWSDKRLVEARLCMGKANELFVVLPRHEAWPLRGGSNKDQGKA